MSEKAKRAKGLKSAVTAAMRTMAHFALATL
jgi:hypothetical protein